MSNKISEMLERLCTEGVGYIKLGELAEISTGQQLNRQDMRFMGEYPVMNGGTLPSGYTDNFNEKEMTITVSQGGASAGFVNWTTSKFWLGAHCYAIHPKQKSITNRFLYFILKSKEEYIMSKKQGAGIPGLNRAELQKIEIPVPPSEVQEEIVKILDRFTEYGRLLEEELKCRKKQYEYYREKLLSFEGDKEVEWKKISKFCKVLRGRRLTKDKLSETGTFPVYHGGLDPLGFYEEANRRENTVMVINVGASAGTVGYSDVEFWSSDGCFCLEHNEDFNPKFLYYYLRSHQNKLTSKVRYAGIPTLDSDVICNFPIPIISLQEQERIVAILDNFEGVGTEIEREIAERKKQYEYYREELLKF